jgi:CheY-like chemotaxis protein
MTHWRVLAVDDEPLNLDIITEILGQEEFLVQTAADGSAAWDLLSNQTFDILILDRMMPGVDGMTLLRRIKSDPAGRRLPVIMQTAAAAPGQVREGIEAGAYYYLTKPYEPKTLLAIVRAAAEAIAARRETADDSRKRMRVLEMARKGAFHFRTLDDAAALADVFSELCPDPLAARTAIAELLINAVEHGNLDIGYEEKSQLCLGNLWHAEIERRLGDPRWRYRHAELEFERDQGAIRLLITDQGSGFDFRRYLDLDPERVFDPNGRGIALASRSGAVSMEYFGRGNVVAVRVELARP